MPGVIVVANQKGGVGKTTTTLHLAQTLGALYEGRVPILAIDADPQGSLEEVVKASRSRFKPEVIALNTARTTHSKPALDRLLKRYEEGIIIIDEPAGSTKHLLEDIALSDLTVLPVIPQRMVVDTFLRFYPGVERRTTPYVLINMWDKRSKTQGESITQTLLPLASHGEEHIIPSRVRLQEHIEADTIDDLFLPHAQNIHWRLPKEKRIKTKKISDTLWAHAKGDSRRAYVAKRSARNLFSTAATLALLLSPTATAKIESKYSDVYAAHKMHTHIVREGESWWHIGKYAYAMNMMEFDLETDEVKMYIAQLQSANENIEHTDLQDYLIQGTTVLVPAPQGQYLPEFVYDHRRDVYERMRKAFFKDQEGLIYITSTFDELRWYRSGRRRVQLPHQAVDMAAPNGTRVYAHCEHHKRKDAGRSPELGWYYAYHCPEDPDTYLIAHLREVIRGEDLIGLVGSTGRSSGDHVHIAIFEGDTLSRRARRLDPLAEIGGLDKSVFSIKRHVQ